MPATPRILSYHHRGGETPLPGSIISEHFNQNFPPFEKGGSGGI
jgi:hypothetical protein